MFAHSAIYFAVRAGNGILGIATLSFLAHALPPVEYGAFALAMAGSSIVSAVSYQWLSVAVSRFYPMYRETPHFVIYAAMRCFSFVTLALVTLALAFYPFAARFDIHQLVWLLLLALAVAQGRYNLILQVLNARGNPLSFGVMSWIRASVGLAAAWLLVAIADLGARGALLGALIGALVVIVAYHRHTRPACVPAERSTGLYKSFLIYGLPLTVTFLAMVLLDVSDRFMIGWILGVAHVAPYSAAYDLAQQSIWALLNVIFLAGFPIVIREFEANGPEAVRPQLKKLASAYFAVGVPGAIGLAVLADDIAIVVFGPSFAADAAAVIPLIALAIFVGAFKSFYLDLSFQMRNSTALLGYVALGMVLVNVALNALLIPQFGILGSAWATLIAFGVGSLMSWYFGGKLLSLPLPVSELVKALCATTFMAIAITNAGLAVSLLSLLAKILIGLIVYVIAGFLLNLVGLRAALQNRARYRV